MKVYIVKAPCGEYDSYKEPIVKVFLDKKKALKYVKEENAKLPLQQAKKCLMCAWKWGCSAREQQPQPECYKPLDYGCCENYNKYCDVQKLFKEEYEVEDE